MSFLRCSWVLLPLPLCRLLAFVSPLRPHWIHALQREFPDLEFSLNGGVKTLDEVEQFLACDASACECSRRPLMPCSVPKGKKPADALHLQMAGAHGAFPPRALTRSSGGGVWLRQVYRCLPQCLGNTLGGAHKTLHRFCSSAYQHYRTP